MNYAILDSRKRAVRNIALDPAGTALAQTGIGRWSNDRWSGNVTYSAVTGATDGPTISDGTKINTYIRQLVTTGRSGLGFHLADNPTAGFPSTTKHFRVTPGEQLRFTVWVRTSVSSTVGLYARGATVANAWSDATQTLVTTNTPLNTWTEITGFYTVPAGVVYTSLAVIVPGSLATNVTLDATGLIVTRGKRKVNYGDGDRTGWRWLGSANASESVGYPLKTISAVIPSNIPPGYTLFKNIDFTSSEGWSIQDGWVKEAGTMRASNVTFGAGPEGKSLHLRGGRDTNGGTIYSSEVRGNGANNKHAVPTYRYTICKFRMDAPVGGMFPAIWERGLGPGWGDGEIDHYESFGTVTAHGNMHTTPYTDPSHRQRPTLNYPSPTGTTQHTIETLMTPDGLTFWYDGVFIETITPANFNTNATPTSNTTMWSPQFDTAAKTWQPIFSNQWHNGYSGGVQANAFTWNMYIDEFKIYTPTSPGLVETPEGSGMYSTGTLVESPAGSGMYLPDGLVETPPGSGMYAV